MRKTVINTIIPPPRSLGHQHKVIANINVALFYCSRLVNMDFILTERK